MKIFIMFSIVFYSFLTINILNGYFNFNNIILIYFIFHVLFIFYFFDLKSFFTQKYKLLSLYENIFPFLSTLTNTTSVIFWRYSILYYSSKEIAGIIFAIFSVASFPGTFYNNILGQTILRQKKLNILFNKHEKTFYALALIAIISAYAYLIKINNFNIDIFIINTLIASLFGTIIMIISLRKRHRSLFKLYAHRNLVFKRDIAYSLIIFPIIIILYNINGINSVSYAYLLSAIVSFLLYSLTYAKNSKHY